jgi:uncharacterized protein YgiM (DUF1202 family)
MMKEKEVASMSVPPHGTPFARGVYALLVLLLVLLIAGCEYITSAMPPTPSPFPTMARLPSVTPVTPSPTMQPSATPGPTVATTPTPIVRAASVAIGANVRSGPDINFAVVTSLVAGTSITLTAQMNEWYRVTTPDGTEGWMSSLVVEAPPESPDVIPTLTATPTAEAENTEEEEE